MSLDNSNLPFSDDAVKLQFSLTGLFGMRKKLPLYFYYAQYQAALRLDEMDCKVHEMLAFQEWIWTRRKSAKRIIFIYVESPWKPQE